MDIVLDAAELADFMQEVFPQVADSVGVEEVTQTGCRVRWRVSEDHLRPGGTVSGPTIFSTADVAAYLAILSRIGRKALAVTTNCSIDFMRKPVSGRDLLGDCKILKLGRVLVVCDVLITSEGDDRPVARASLTYSIPPK